MNLENSEIFYRKIHVPFVEVNLNDVQLIKKRFRKSLLKAHIPSVVEVEGRPDMRRIRFDPFKVTGNQSIDLNTDIHFEDIELFYKDLNLKECIKIFLADKNLCNKALNTSSHKCIGHIVQLNLRDQLLPYKYVIGQIFLDKVSNIRTVINKSGKIDNEYRKLDFELIAGDPDYITQCRENYFTYKMDFSKVYWNPNLGHERELIIKSVCGNENVFDVFAGVGPFVIPMAVKGCHIYANDLNPECVYWLKLNFEFNTKGAQTGAFEIFNMDGYQFIKNEVVPRCTKNKNHVIMNLPELSLSFLKAFSDLELNDYASVNIYCYAFTDNINELRETIKREFDRFDTDINIRIIKRVSPKKDMACCLIKLKKNNKRSIGLSIDEGTKKLKK